MITTSLRVIDNGLIDAYIELADNPDAFVNVVTNQTVNETADELLADFQIEPGPVTYPIQWASARQRRYVMAQIRSGAIRAPYVRSHAVSKGWQIAVIYVPGELSQIELSNMAEHFTFVEGLRQQPYHRNTGWFQALDKVETWQKVLTDRIETALIRAWYAVEPKDTANA